ncbi:MAG: polysialyltransferase family glycosyltransferase [Lachnospiraceae bacterium]|nr:polysialyltransferase family glycosyltransferase [Lachnospiraceae bacterium]
MIQCTEAELLQKIAQKNDINFLAAAITPWHAIGISAYILKLTEEQKELKGYIMLMPHGLTGYALTEDNFQIAQKHNNLELVKIISTSYTKSIREKVRDKFQLYQYYLDFNRQKQKKGTLYWAVPEKPSYDLIPKIDRVVEDKRLEIILTDEGTGSYVLTRMGWWRTAYKQAGIRGTKNILCRDPLFLWCLKKKKQVCNFKLLAGNIGQYHKNPKAADYYKKIMEMQVSGEDYSYYDDAIVINPNMMYESGLLSDQSEIKLYEKIGEALKERKETIIVKPHPREIDHIDKYENIPNCRIEQSRGMAQETILAMAKKKPRCMIGFTSTALITAKILFGIEAISAIHMIDEDKILCKESFNIFERAFGNLLKMPETMEEMLDIIELSNRK